jgi:hypothetical protein
MRRPREHWGDGPWQNEPDKLDWRDDRTSLWCAIRRAPIGSLCGYVGVPPGHVLFGWHHGDDVQVREEFLRERNVGGDLSSVDVFMYMLQGGPKNGTIPLGMALRVHWGVNWAGEFPLDDAPCEAWWFGFDCGHAGDLVPSLADFFRGFRMLPVPVYRDIEYVKGQCELLAFQLRQLEAEFDLTGGSNAHLRTDSSR